MAESAGQSLFSRLILSDDAVVAYARWVIRWRWALIAVSVALALAAASGGRFLGFATDYRVFFSGQNPQLEAFETLQKVYTRDDNISFVIKPAEGEVFTPELLGAIRELTEAAWQIPFTTRVDSLTNFQHSFAEGDDLTVRDLVTRDMPLTPETLGEIRAIAMSEPLLLDRVVSPDGTTTNVSVTVNLPQESVTEVPAAMTHARELADAFTAEFPGTRVALTGTTALNAAFTEASIKDMSTLIPIMYGILLLGMVLLLRSFSGTFSTLMVIGLSAMTAMGLAGWFRIPLTPVSAVAPTVILTIAVADSIHVLVTMLKVMREGGSKHEAIAESVRINFGPVFLTSLTTIIGFLSLNFSDSPPFWHLGNITSMGVAAAWGLSIVFLPALMAVLPVRVRQRARRGPPAMEMLAEFVIRRRQPVLIGMTGLVVVLALMVPRIELNDQFVSYFDKSIPFRADTDFAAENLSGIYQVQWSLPSGGEGAISEPEYLARVDDFSNWLRARDEVVHVQTLTDTFRRLNKNLHGDDEAFYVLPEERELGAQYLLLFEMSLPYGLDLNNQINVDKSATRLIATTNNITTNQLRAFDNEASDWLRTNLVGASSTSTAAAASGPFVMFAYISDRNIKGMLTGTALAVLLISLSLTAALRHAKLGFVSLVPNLVPAFMAFGVWALFVGQVGIASSIVVATSLGIIVDATVHFLSKYMRARRQRQASPEDAVRYAFSTVGTALWVSSAILIAGFTVLALSTFKLNQNMGLLTALAIAAAIIADFLLLPALLITIDKQKPLGKEGHDDAIVEAAA